MGRYLRTVAVAGVLLYTGCNVVGNNWQYSDGARVGVVNKFTKSGLVWKTHEGEMALEGLVSSGSGTSANLWHFSIDDQARNGENKQALVKEIADALNSGKKVKITYKEMVETWPWRSGTDYLVQSVEPLQPKQ